MSRLVAVALLVVVVATLSGCDETCPAAAAPPPVSSYERGCVADDDCALATIPNCGPCSCPDTPLRAADIARFDDEQTICCDEPVDAGVDCGACLNVVPVCLDGSCAALNCDDAGDPRCD